MLTSSVDLRKQIELVYLASVRTFSIENQHLPLACILFFFKGLTLARLGFSKTLFLFAQELHVYWVGGDIVGIHGTERVRKESEEHGSTAHLSRDGLSHCTNWR